MFDTDLSWANGYVPSGLELELALDGVVTPQLHIGQPILLAHLLKTDMNLEWSGPYGQR